MINALLPKHLEERFTWRARNVIYAACALRTPDGDTQDISRFLYALSKERGSLGKNILQTHKVTSASISRLSPLQPRRRASGKSDKGLRVIVKKAMWVAAKQHQPYVGTEHLLYAVICRMQPRPAQPRSLASPPTRRSGRSARRTFFTESRIRKIKEHLDTIFSQSMHFPHVFKNWKSYMDLGFF